MKRRKVVTILDTADVDLMDHLGGRNRILVPAHPHTVCSPKDAFSGMEEVSVASRCVPSSLTNLAAWGLVREYQSTKPTLAQLDGDSD